MSLKLVFADRLLYRRDEDPRAPKKALSFRMLNEIQAGNSGIWRASKGNLRTALSKPYRNGMSS